MKSSLRIRGLMIAVGIGIGAFPTPKLLPQEKPIPPTSQELTEETYSKWRDFILPTPEELRWQQIPWRRSWTEALCEAQAKDKPILLWAMNGHPLDDC